MENTHWKAFKEINRNRRSIRDFDGKALPDEDIKELLVEAAMAPSSANAQPFQFHWIQNPEIKAKVAAACNGQKAASLASTLIVMVASTTIAKNSVKQYSSYIEQSTWSEKSRSYYLGGLKIMHKFLKFGPLIVWTPLLNLISIVLPSLSLWPFGGIGVRQWHAKNSIFAAQNLMLAATAKGYDTCPMEGFNAQKIVSILKLPYGSVIPVVIALGKKTNDAQVELQWRRPFEDSVVIH